MLGYQVVTVFRLLPHMWAWGAWKADQGRTKSSRWGNGWKEESLWNFWGEALGLLVVRRKLLDLRTADTLPTPFHSTWPLGLQERQCDTPALPAPLSPLLLPASPNTPLLGPGPQPPGPDLVPVCAEDRGRLRQGPELARPPSGRGELEGGDDGTPGTGKLAPPDPHFLSLSALWASAAA